MRKFYHNWWTRSSVCPVWTSTKCTWSNKTLPSDRDKHSIIILFERDGQVHKCMDHTGFDGLFSVFEKKYWIWWFKAETLLQGKLHRSKELVEIGTICGPWACSLYYGNRKTLGSWFRIKE